MLVTEYENHRVSQFALDTGAFIRIFAGSPTAQWGSGDGLFDFPCGIAVLPSSNEAAVIDEQNHRVQIFDSEGKYLRQIGGTKGTEDGQFSGPASVAADAYDNILVTDYDTDRLQLFNSKGEHVCICLRESELPLTGLSLRTTTWYSRHSTAQPGLSTGPVAVRARSIAAAVMRS